MRLDGSRLALGNGQRAHEGDDTRGLSPDRLTGFSIVTYMTKPATAMNSSDHRQRRKTNHAISPAVYFAAWPIMSAAVCENIPTTLRTSSTALFTKQAPTRRLIWNVSRAQRANATIYARGFSFLPPFMEAMHTSSAADSTTAISMPYSM